MSNLNAAAIGDPTYDIIMTPGVDGKVTIVDTNDGELISVNTGSKPSLTVLGETFELETIKQLLLDARSRAGNCTCPLKQIMAKGCTCGGK